MRRPKARYEVSPCKDCIDRKPICHDSCSKYIDWKTRAKNHKDNFYAQHGEIVSYKSSKIKKAR